MINGSEEMTDNGIIEKYCYDDDPNNCEKYGGLYQRDEVMQYSTDEGIQGLCPEGWHVPIFSEIQELESYVNDESKRLVNQDQTTINYTATNESGFSSLFVGSRKYDHSFISFGKDAFFFSSTIGESGVSVYGMSLYYTYDFVNLGTRGKSGGYCIRCLKD